MKREEIRALVEEMIYKILAELNLSQLMAVPPRNRCMPEMDGLLTEADIIRMNGQGIRTITVEKGCIVTPLATDKAREYNITICKEEG
ncbi:MAG: hypothetical protein FWB91_04775 [Defluviitaleaceae bacterium]|nr:hypothetical protein [Defluviitaleaceae bacterium]